MEASRETEIRELDVTVLVNENVVRLNVTVKLVSSTSARHAYRYLPVNEPEFMHCFDRQNAFCDVESGNVF